ncbi:MAG: histidine kinase [Chitinophagaceae bacterium]|nr:histidine kinase [Chitinophagaceae bacterium]
MRKLICVLYCMVQCLCYGQYPYVKKLNYPEQMPTQKVFDMLTDSKGYIWIGTDKGLFRSNGQSFTPIPFTNTTLVSVSYLQEDRDGTVWCMNFHNQLFYYRNDSLHRYAIDPNLSKNEYSFTNVVVGNSFIWFNTFDSIYKFDKATHAKLQVFRTPGKHDPIIASSLRNNTFHALSSKGFFFDDKLQANKKWVIVDKQFVTARLINTSEGIIALGTSLDRESPVHIRNGIGTALRPVQLPPDIIIFQAVSLDGDQYWLCTQNGAYTWDPATGTTHCYLPGERVSDVVQDYQGNLWFSTLDNGIFICPSLSNKLLKIYNDPLQDNFTRLEALPSGNILAGNSQGLLTRVNLDKHEIFHYEQKKARETEFIHYDTLDKIIFTERGTMTEFSKKQLTSLYYSKGVSRDRYNNLLVAVYNAALVMNNNYNSIERLPALNNPLYRKIEEERPHTLYDVNHRVLQVRAKRSLSILGAQAKDVFWIAYEDGLYQYNYNGDIRLLEDRNGGSIIGKCLVQLPDDRLVVGTSNKGVLILKNGLVSKAYNVEDGLSSQNVSKILVKGHYIWVLTNSGFDRIDLLTNSVTNYLDEYGLSNIIINDVIMQNNKLLFATPAGILVRDNLKGASRNIIRFPLLRASSEGLPLNDGAVLRAGDREISFYFEALHYTSPGALTYRYRLNNGDTVWHTVNNLGNQAVFNALAPGNYRFEVQALAGLQYSSEIRSFRFTVQKMITQKWWFWGLVLFILMTGCWLFLRNWKERVLARQTLKEHLLKSQLTAIRAQMNPHFLYNVLNTVQGLVYGNRRAAAGELLGNFSDLMRKVLQSSDKQLITLKDEIENLRLYLELEKARFDEGFSYTIDMVNMGDTSRILVPSLLLQPFAENAIKHGLMHKRGIKTLAVLFEKTAGGLIVVIDDNGIGRARSMEINRRKPNKPAAFATVALNERMELFNRLYNNQISCEVTDKIDNDGNPAGTRVGLYIPDYHPGEGAL